MHAWSGRFKESLELLSQSVTIYQELNLKQDATFMLLVKGLVELNMLELSQARQDFQNCIFASRGQNYPRGIGVGLFGLGCVSFLEGNPQKAEELFLQAISILQDAQADEVGWCVALLVYTMRSLGQPQRGWQYARQGLEIGLKAHVYLTAANTIRGIALLLMDAGQVERAIELHEMTRRYPIYDGSSFYQELSAQLIERVAASLPLDTVIVAKERGRQRDLFATAEELLAEITS